MTSNPRGKFITFEGGEGVGKSTNIHWCADWLTAQNIDVIVTREPGGTPIAELIRNKLLKAHHAEPMVPMAELLLMFAARAQHLEAVILPALSQGTWVLCDRFTDSTIAYQGFGRGLDLSSIETLKTLVQGTLEPDCTLLLDAPIEVGMARAHGRSVATGEATDRFEIEQLAFFERVRDGFQTLAATHSRFVTQDATQTLDDIQAELAIRLSLLIAP
jgi:dTMP kinase|tara:strand:+ start:195 stop:845 length:651 start_codon:yes stop_codon:yes gene_type:complete